MRLLIPATFFALCILPVAALVWNQAYFPTHIEQRLNQSAQSGDLADVTNEANRLTSLYPTYEKTISSYVKNVVAPATKIIASMQEQPSNRKSASRSIEQNMAYELNDLDTGAQPITK